MMSKVANKPKIKQNLLCLARRLCLQKLDNFFIVNKLGNLLSPVEVVRNVGVWLDSDCSFSCHAMDMCKAGFVHISDLKRLRGYLTHDVGLLAANALAGSHLDYCNFLFRTLSALDHRKFQCFLELLPIPPGTHICLLSEKLFICCQSGIVLCVQSVHH